MKLFAQIRKVDEEKRLVFGRAAEEIADNADEVMDYLTSKPYFEKWSADISKDSGGKNLGNVRAMHGKVAAGGLKSIDYDDTGKAIDVCAHIVDDQEWKKVLAGTYTGFSIGGSYIGDKKVEKMDGREVKRYTARPNEISLVDRPCIPTAKFFEVQKADGSLRKVDFAPAADVDVQVKGTAEQIAALGKALNANGLDLADTLAMVEKALPDFIAAKKKKAEGKGDDADADDKDAKDAKAKKDAAAKKADTPEDLKKMEQATLRKSMYSCSQLASTIASLQSLQSSAAYEAFSKGDDSGIAAKLKACIAMCGGVLKDMVDVEIADPDGDGGDTVILALAEKAGALAKFEGDPLVELLKAEGVLAKAGARHSAADAGRLKSIHDAAVGMGADCDGKGGADKADAAGDLAKVEAANSLALEKLEKAETERMQKIVDAAVAPLQKLLDGAAAEIKLLKAQPAPATVSLRAIAKSDDNGASGDQPTAAAATVKDSYGDVHEGASLIKSIHQSGGVPFSPLAKAK